MQPEPRPQCNQCGRVIRRGMKVPYCSECRHMRCIDCGVILPRANVKRRCGNCQREATLRYFNQPGRRCCLCKVLLPTGHPHTRCHPCLQEEHRWYREWLTRRPDPHCVDCGVSIRGRPSVRCRPCAQRYKLALPRRLCPTCKERQAKPGKSYCPPCEAMYARWRRAYNQGDPGARALKAKKVYHWRKKKEEPA